MILQEDQAELELKALRDTKSGPSNANNITSMTMSHSFEIDQKVKLDQLCDKI